MATEKAINMDYSYFSQPPQPYQYFALPPTPTQSNTPPPGDYRTALSPVGVNEDPLNNYPAPNTEGRQEQFDAAFAAFQQNFRYDPTSFAAQQRDSMSHSPPKSPRNASSLSMSEGNGHGYQPIAADFAADFAQDDGGRGRSSSEEKEILTPAQSRRKAQNRAAQRAFRERKERRVKDLEAKLTTLEHESASLNGENERLKKQLTKFATENEILRATSGGHGPGPHPFAEEPDEITATAPMYYSPKDFYSKLGDPSKLPGDRRYVSSQRIIISAETGERLLTVSATWDYIQAHELHRKGLVDIGGVFDRLKKLARCDGQGPVFEERDVRNAIKESAVAGGRDELI